MYLLRKIFLHSPVHYAVAVVLAVVVAVLRFAALPADAGAQFAWYESLSVSGYVTFLIGALITVAYYGAFDIFTYAFSAGRFGKGKKYKNYADYSVSKSERRSRENYYFVPYFVVGVVVFLISLLFA